MKQKAQNDFLSEVIHLIILVVGLLIALTFIIISAEFVRLLPIVLQRSTSIIVLDLSVQYSTYQSLTVLQQHFVI